MSPVIIYDACQDGQQQQNISPKHPVIRPSNARRKGEKNNGQRSNINPKQRTQQRRNPNAKFTKHRMPKLCTHITPRMHNPLPSIQTQK